MTATLEPKSPKELEDFLRRASVWYIQTCEAAGRAERERQGLTLEDRLGRIFGVTPAQVRMMLARAAKAEHAKERRQLRTAAAREEWRAMLERRKARRRKGGA